MDTLNPTLYRIIPENITHSERDRWQEGCLPESSITEFNRVETSTHIFTDFSTLVNSLKQAVNEADDKNVLVNSCDEYGRIDIQTYTLKPIIFNKLSNASRKKWQADNIDVYLNTASFYIEQSVVNKEQNTIEWQALKLPVLDQYSNDS